MREAIRFEVEFTDQFKDWWETLDEQEQDDIDVTVGLLEEHGPTLPYPYSSGVKGSRHSRLRELRAQSAGNALRIFYALDPRRRAILLIGGNKSGNDRFYEQLVPVADRLYDKHLQEIGKHQ